MFLTTHPSHFPFSLQELLWYKRGDKELVVKVAKRGYLIDIIMGYKSQILHVVAKRHNFKEVAS